MEVDPGRVQEAGPAGPDQEPGHVRGRGRLRSDPVHRDQQAVGVQLDHRGLAVPDGGVRQPGGGGGRGPGQGPGRHTAPGQARDDGAAAAQLARRHCPRRAAGRVRARHGADPRRLRGSRGGPGHPRRRRRGRGRRLGGRVGHHRRVRPGHQGVGGDRSAVTGGTTVLSDRIVVRITSRPGETFIDRMIALVEGAKRQKTPNEIALNILLASLTIIFMLAVISLQPMAFYSKAPQTLVILVALLVALIPTTIGALLSAIGIAGMDRLVQRNVLAISGRAVEAAGDVNTLLLDKTGTITIGNRQASEFLPVGGATAAEVADAAQLSSMADYTPEGRSVVVLAKNEYGLRERHEGELAGAEFIEFSAQTRMSGVDLADGRQVRKGAASAVAQWIRDGGGTVPADLGPLVDGISAAGGTPLVVAEKSASGVARALGVIHLKDIVKEGIAERFAEMRKMGIRTVMITGDNPLTAKAIADESGVDDFLAEATPEDKMALISREQEGGKLVAMTGDGTNDAPALAQADVGVAMYTGTSAAKEAGNMVDLDSNPTKLIEIVEIGKQLLITRGALTTFSIANDVAKYFAIIPAMFASVIPGLARLNILGLHSPASAITSAIIFNALIIIALIPLSLRGVRYRPSSASALLRRNLWIYGLGGLLIPFAGIKLIDLIVQFIPGIG